MVEIITEENSGFEIDQGAGAAAAAAVEGAMRKQNIARQQRFFEIARTRSARYKIQKYLTERGYPAEANRAAGYPLPPEAPDLDVVVELPGAAANHGKTNAVSSAAKVRPTT